MHLEMNFSTQIIPCSGRVNAITVSFLRKEAKMDPDIFSERREESNIWRNSSFGGFS
jgi:hypothetical protein